MIIQGLMSESIGNEHGSGAVDDATAPPGLNTTGSFERVDLIRSPGQSEISDHLFTETSSEVQGSYGPALRFRDKSPFLIGSNRADSPGPSGLLPPRPPRYSPSYIHGPGDVGDGGGTHFSEVFQSHMVDFIT